MGGVTKPGGDAERGRRVGVGVRVSTRRTGGSGPVGDPGLRVAGVIIEDHSDILTDAGGVGRDWALPGAGRLLSMTDFWSSVTGRT